MHLLDLPISTLIAVLMVSAFCKIFTTLNIARFGIGLSGAGFGFVIAALSLALSAIVCEPFLSSNQDTSKLTIDQVQQKFKPFLIKQSDPAVYLKISKVINSSSLNKNAVFEAQKIEDANYNLLLAVFLISELKEAFKLGFLILLPLILIDILVVNVLMLLGITNLPASIISLPIKILLFFSVDGWLLIVEKVIRTYQ